MKRVTALHPERRDRVRVELDGEPWRTLPTDAVVGAGLMIGGELDRARARELARSLRRTKALKTAAAALSRRDRSAAGLRAYLGERGVKESEQAEAIEVLSRFGYVDDLRFAADRAAALAGRGFGDEAIRYDLEQQLVSAEQIEAALERLEPEVARARSFARNTDPIPKSARRLAAKGFSLESIESALGVFEA